jgi:C-terminal processing protease CtpA/Prc
MRRRLVAAALVLLLFPIAARAAEPAAVPAAQTPLERLTQVGKLWGLIRYLHPYLAYKEINWDAALVAALPKVQAAKTLTEYAAAVGEMLAALGDPVTRLLDPATEQPATPATAEKTAAGEAPAVVRSIGEAGDAGERIVVVAPWPLLLSKGYGSLRREITAHSEEITQARAVILDLRRGPRPIFNLSLFSYPLGVLTDLLVGQPCHAPSQRYVFHSGYQTQSGGQDGGYFSGFLTDAAASFQPSPQVRQTPRRVVFLLDGDGPVPPLAFALQACGSGRIVSQGRLTEEAVIATRPFPLGEGLTAQVRMSEAVPFPGWPGVHADAETAKDARDAAFEAALAQARTETPRLETPRLAATPETMAAPPRLPDSVFRHDERYRDMQEPSLPYRQLAVIRAWNIIHLFYPYLHLIGDWDAVLPEYLTRMATATTGRDYALTIAEMMTHVPDGHVRVSGHPEITRTLGETGLPLEIRWIEDAPVVVAIGEGARDSGLEVGDAILAVNGEPAAARIERASRYIASSTRPFLLYRVCNDSLVNGPPGSTAVLTVQGVDGKTREVRLVRDPKAGSLYAYRTGDTVLILPGNIGYADLTRLQYPEVDAMFEKLRDTKGIIFDMRGYPNGTAWDIAPRINTRKARSGPQFRRVEVSDSSIEEGSGGRFFVQPMPEDGRGLSLYTHPTLMLIDERAISQSEHSGLIFEAANGTRFVGTPSAGADGDITQFFLPGGISVFFSGHDIRHADGSQLQRLGLQPYVEVAPTRKGLHEGKDEVLERAVKVLEEDRAQ